MTNLTVSSVEVHIDGEKMTHSLALDEARVRSVGHGSRLLAESFVDFLYCLNYSYDDELPVGTTSSLIDDIDRLISAVTGTVIRDILVRSEVLREQLFCKGSTEKLNQLKTLLKDIYYVHGAAKLGNDCGNVELSNLLSSITEVDYIEDLTDKVGELFQIWMEDDEEYQGIFSEDIVIHSIEAE